VIVRGIQDNTSIVVGKLEGAATGMKIKRPAQTKDQSPSSNTAPADTMGE